MTSPILTVVVGTRNRLNQLRRCVDSIAEQTHVSHETVVVDAGSTDGTVEYLEGCLGVRLVCDGKPLGQAKSLNTVFRGITTQFACWLSDDNVLVNGMLDTAVDILEQNPDVGLVALKVKDVVGPFQSDPYIGGIWPTGVLNCNQGVIRTQLFKDIGLFDEEFRDYGTDPDLTTRVLLAGYKVVHTKAIAIHHYRDYFAAPGAIDNAQRSQRAQAAMDLYRCKYGVLVPKSSILDRMLSKLSRSLVQLLSAGYAGARRLAIPIESWVGCSERDWRNVLTSRFISKSDLIRNRNQPFYLVQVMPAEPRLKWKSQQGNAKG